MESRITLKWLRGILSANCLAKGITTFQQPVAIQSWSTTAKTYIAVPDANDPVVFKYLDTASARAGTSELLLPFHSQVIGLVGLGGTGSYILDSVAKTPVKEVHHLRWRRDAFPQCVPLAWRG